MFSRRLPLPPERPHLGPMKPLASAETSRSEMPAAAESFAAPVEPTASASSDAPSTAATVAAPPVSAPTAPKWATSSS